MVAFRYQVVERVLSQPMPGHGGFTGEFARDDHELKMAATVLRPCMAGMFVAVVEYLQRLRSQTRQALANHLFDVHYFGNTLRKGFTVTLAKTPSVTQGSALMQALASSSALNSTTIRPPVM